MPIGLNVNGTTYNYPLSGEVQWGVQATNWAAAMTSGVLQKQGGLFTLAADVDFGATYGLQSTYYKSRNLNVAQSGILRLGNLETVVWRNAANNGDLGLTVNASNQLEFNGSPLGSGSVTSISVDGTAGNISSSGSPIITSGTITVDLVDTAVTPASYTYASITVDSKGRITSASSGTPPSGGTVTSVGVSGANGIGVASSPITSSGTIALSLGDLTPTGNLTLATTKRIFGDFSNATAANRTFVQTSTTNGATTLSVAPNGTGTVSAFSAENNSTIGNNAALFMASNASANILMSGTRGSGTQLPLYIGSVTGLSMTAGTSAIVINTANNVSMPQTLTVTGTINGSNLSGTNTGDQTITLTGDVTGSGTGSFATTLANTAVTPGSYIYSNITVDSKGRITSASSGAAPTGGTVTSVDAAGNNGITVSGGPITTSGTLTFGLGNITPANVTPTGTLTLASSLPVTGDLTTLATRAYFQTSTANSTTSLDVSPSGTGTRAIVYAYDNSDRANSAYVAMDANSFSGFAGLYTNVNGTGTQRGLLISAAGNIGFGISTTGNAFAGSSSLTTSSTDGYVYLPSIAGVPAGVPTTVTNRNAVAVDRTNGNLYFYAGSWKRVNTGDTAVTPGSYTNANITVNQEGRITAASSGTGGLVAPNYEEFVATAAQTVFNTTMTTTAKGSGKAYLQVYVNGVFQQEGATKAFTVTGATQITFNAGLALNDDVAVFGYV